MIKIKLFKRRDFIANAFIGVLGIVESKGYLVPEKSGSKQFQSESPLTGTGIIAGTILGGSDIYIPHSVVQLYNRVTRKIETVVSEYSGKYEFKGLAPGSYQLSVPSMQGFTPKSIELSKGAKAVIDLRIKKIKISKHFAKPHAMQMKDLSRIKTGGVSVIEVNDYIFGNYKGDLHAPPNADRNPRKAFIIRWENFPYTFVFAHECSYCPFFEFPSGAGVCYQFFEGNEGRAELFNAPGRMEKNSFVDIIESGPQRVWVRWTYFGVNQETGEQYYRGTEDFWAYPSGMVVRKQSFLSLRNDIYGYSREPIELIGMCPASRTWVDVLAKDPQTNEHHALTVLDAFSQNRYDVFWKHKVESIVDSNVRRAGASWRELNDAKGVALILPTRHGSAFCIFGNASGFRNDYTRIKEHSHKDTGGLGWGSQSWDHWPIGWLNSQLHEVNKDSLQLYPNHFSPAGMDFFALPNEEVEGSVFYSLIGVSQKGDEFIRNIAKQWLINGESGVANFERSAGIGMPKEI